MDKIQKYKEAHSSTWFKQCGASFAVAYDYVKSLVPNQMIDYGYLIGLFQNARKKSAMKTMKLKSVNFEELRPSLNRRRSDAANY